ncbi:MAG TPA: xanthine dehydrogenase family protein molybdopterin-binding subunit, partial [Vicinamibacterales bacterium]|nr:xanthine dehydrogenase family protein molybdopterin-binding subunit [Vicinamibacterales bacterium]
AKPTLIGTRIKRLDGPDKVSGRARYTHDINRPNMLYGRIVRSPYPHARVTAIDLSEALRAPGVKAAYNVKEPGAQVMYQGDMVAAVAADTEERATDAMRLVKVTYEQLPFFMREQDAMDPDAPVVFMGGNTRAGRATDQGDVEAGFKEAAHVIEAEYYTHVITHVCMESHSVVAEWEGDKLTAWCSAQGVFPFQQQIATAMNVPPANVRVITQYMGGGFGSKLQAGQECIVGAKLAQMTKQPVKVALDRKEEHLDTGNRPSAGVKVKAGVTADGTLTAYQGTSYGTGGAGQTIGNLPIPYIYNFPNRKIAHTDVFINTGTQRPMRAPGHPQACFLTEVLMDELADRVKMDPVEFRIKNAPPLAPNQMYRNYLPEGAKLFGWDKRHPTGDPTPGPIKTGMGCSVHTWGGGGSGTQAHCDISADGSVVMKCGTQDIGTGTRTIVTLVTAETLGLPMEAVRAEIGDTNYPRSGGSGGSTTAASAMPAIRLTAAKALEALFAKVAPVMAVPADQLEAVNGKIQVKGNPAKSMAWKDACKVLGTETISVDHQWETGFSGVTTSGVQFAEVQVDIETGITKLKRILAIQDCGLVVDKLLAESQVHGGIIGAISFALYEDRILDRVTGQMVNPNMEMYLLTGPSDVPQVDIVLKDMPERGVIGIGEPPTVSTGSAIANALRNATGATFRSLPLHPHRVLQVLEQQKAGGTL